MEKTQVDLERVRAWLRTEVRIVVPRLWLVVGGALAAGLVLLALD